MKRKTLLLIPLLIISAMLVYCWTVILTTGGTAGWRHYAGLALYAVPVLLFFRNTGLAAIATGLYLLLATFNLLAITSPALTFTIRIGSVSAPPVQSISLGLLALFVLLNFNTLAIAYHEFRNGRPIT